MAVVRVEPLWSGRSSNFEADGRRDYTAQVRVVTDSVTDSQLVVQFAAGVPRVGLGFYVASDGTPDYQAVCTRATPRQDDSSGLIWIVDCEFSTAGLALDPAGFGGGGTGGDAGGFRPGQGGAADDPTKKPPRWRIGWQSARRPERRQLKDETADPPDWSGNANVNWARDWFDPLPEREAG